ncbi:hypothetical protein KM043_005436 [Ampulex compressa]|nr:hypothetical protein KM043_005436 [Ampulex compressa]
MGEKILAASFPSVYNSKSPDTPRARPGLLARGRAAIDPLQQPCRSASTQAKLPAAPSRRQPGGGRFALSSAVPRLNLPLSGVRYAPHSPPVPSSPC